MSKAVLGQKTKSTQTSKKWEFTGRVFYPGDKVTWIRQDKNKIISEVHAVVVRQTAKKVRIAISDRDNCFHELCRTEKVVDPLNLIGGHLEFK